MFTPIRRLALLLLWGGAGSVAACAADRPCPETRSGPYRLVVERITQNQYTQALFVPPPERLQSSAPGSPEPVRGVGRERAAAHGAGGPLARTGRRNVQIQLRLLADDAESAAAVELLAVHTLVVTQSGVPVQVAHYGGQLEDLEDAVLRAYVYATDVGLQTSEVRSIEGEVVSAEHVRLLTVELPLQGLPAQRESHGVRFSVTGCTLRGNSATVRLTARPPAGTRVIPAGADAAYGARLLAEAGAAPAAGSSTLNLTTAGELELELSFQGVRGTPDQLRLPLILRSGSRRCYPFQLGTIPLPRRP